MEEKKRGKKKHAFFTIVIDLGSAASFFLSHEKHMVLLSSVSP